MTALGQKQTYAVQNGVSALPPIAPSVAFFTLKPSRRCLILRRVRHPCRYGKRHDPPCRMEIFMAKYKVGYFVGSLSSTSINRMLAKALVRVAPPELELTEIPIKDLPLYSQDYDADYPPVARAFKKAIADVDAVLFVTPEFNRSIPGGLKNEDDNRTLVPSPIAKRSDSKQWTIK